MRRGLISKVPPAMASDCTSGRPNGQGTARHDSPSIESVERIVHGLAGANREPLKKRHRIVRYWADSLDVVVRSDRKVEERSAGLPFGVQVVARRWCEDVVMAVRATCDRVGSCPSGADYLERRSYESSFKQFR